MLTLTEMQETTDDEGLHDLIMIEAESRVADPSDTGLYLKSIQELPVGLKACWLSWIFQAEVENGGIGQYFWNIKEEAFYRETLGSLQLMEAKEIAHLFEESLRIRTQYLSQTQHMEDWGDYVEIMGSVPLEDNHGDFGDRLDEALEQMQSIRVAFVRQNPHLFLEG
jgi:hypothetical protein